MRIELLHFASFREAAGRDQETREVTEGTRVRELWASLSKDIPLFARFPSPPPAAVNREYVPAETILQDGDEVAFLPPVAGAEMPYLTDAPIDVAALLSEARSADGALCLFVGVVRDHNEGRPTVAIQYEAYGPMAESEMGRIADALLREFPAVQLRMKHRVGRLSVGEPSVAIVAVAPHRSDAFAACRAAIDRVKATVPIWKKEFHPDGSSDWVDPTRHAGADAAR